MNPFEHSLCSDHLITPSEGSHSRTRFDLHMFLPVHEPPQFPCASIFSNPLDQGERREFDHPPEPVLEADEHFLSIGSSWQQSIQRPSSSPLPTISKDDEDQKKKKKKKKNSTTVTSGESVDPSSVKSGSSGRWLSSKVKTARKVVNPDRITGSNMLQARDPPQSTTDGGSSNKNGGGQLLSCSGTGMIRVCSDCNTTKTPLWRSGPSGPKSLCNACGIRRRKARRAMAAAAAGLVPGAGVGPSSSKLQRKEKMSEGGSSSTMPFKKRCKFVTSAQTSKQLHFDDVDVLALDLSKNPTGGRLQRVFPQDEKEAAMLLMALSCGLIRG